MGGLPFVTSVDSEEELSDAAFGVSSESSFCERFLAAFGDGFGVGETLPVRALDDRCDELCALDDE